MKGCSSVPTLIQSANPKSRLYHARTMWLREYMSFSPLSTNHRLCQLCLREPHFMRYPDSTGLEGEAASLTPVPEDGERTTGFVFGEASSESEEVS